MRLGKKNERMRTCQAVATLLVAGSAVSAAGAAAPVSFNRDVRPILSDKCFRCHGPDARHRKAGLRLDVEESATAELDSGSTAIVAGKIDESELVRRILADDEAERMPPAESGKSLTEREKATLKSWIEQGG